MTAKFEQGPRENRHHYSEFPDLSLGSLHEREFEPAHLIMAINLAMDDLKTLDELSFWASDITDNPTVTIRDPVVHRIIWEIADPGISGKDLSRDRLMLYIAELEGIA